MTVSDVLAQVRALRSTTFSDAQLTTWLNEVEGHVATDVLLWPVRKVVPYSMAQTVTVTGARPMDDRHLVLPEPVDLAPGGAVTISGLTTYSSDNGGPWELIALSDDRVVLTFQPGTFAAYGDAPDAGTAALAYDGSGCQLLALPPHDKIYRPYLLAQMAFAQEEWDGYANYMALYNEYLGEYKRWFTRTYNPRANPFNWRCMP